MWSLKDDEYQTSYDEQPLDEHGVQQQEAPEEEEEGGEEQQEEEEEDTAEGSQVFDTEEVCWDPPYNTFCCCGLIVFFSKSDVGTQHRRSRWLTIEIYFIFTKSLWIYGAFKAG